MLVTQQPVVGSTVEGFVPSKYIKRGCKGDEYTGPLSLLLKDMFKVEQVFVLRDQVLVYRAGWLVAIFVTDRQTVDNLCNFDQGCPDEFRFCLKRVK